MLMKNLRYHATTRTTSKEQASFRGTVTIHDAYLVVVQALVTRSDRIGKMMIAVLRATAMLVLDTSVIEHVN